LEAPLDSFSTKYIEMAYVLCVDDEESISSLIRQILRMNGHEVEIAPDGFTAFESVERREPDLIILDRSMPGMDGIEVCRKIKSNPFLSRIPVLMLTALASIDFKVEGFDAGADDYLTKPFEPRELTARVSSLLRMTIREGDRNPSSGLPGGRAIGYEIEERLKRAETFSVIYIDLDNFKPFADTFGFIAADEIITKTGKMLGAIAASDLDFAGHIGGDDFLVICDENRAQNLAELASVKFKEVLTEVIGTELTEKGSFKGVNRTGELQEFPLTGLTAVIVPVDNSNFISLSHLGEAAATWKKAAKSDGGGKIVVAQ
jgi:DNA-binding response OmpR family regulator